MDRQTLKKKGREEEKREKKEGSKAAWVWSPLSYFYSSKYSPSWPAFCGREQEGKNEV